MSESFLKGNISVDVLFSVAGLATQIFISDKDSSQRNILLDIGDGTCRDLLNKKIDLKSINYVLLSHDHYDHIGGLYSFLGIQRMLGRKTELTIISPKSTIILDIINIFKRNYENTIPYEINWIEAPQKDIKKIKIKNNSLIITSIPVLHRDSILGYPPSNPINAVSYKVSFLPDNFNIAFSGDSAPCDNLKILFENVDYGLIEATHPNKEFISHKLRYHLTEQEALGYVKHLANYKIIHRFPSQYVNSE